MARAAGVGARELREINARHRSRRYGPRCRFRPIPAVDQMRRVVGDAGDLVAAGDIREGNDFSRAGAVDVVPQTIDVDVEANRRRLHLEANRIALVDADVGRKTLKRAVACAADVPFGAGISGLQVLAHDRIRSALRSEARADRLSKQCQRGDRRSERRAHACGVLMVSQCHSNRIRLTKSCEKPMWSKGSSSVIATPEPDIAEARRFHRPALHVNVKGVTRENAGGRSAMTRTKSSCRITKV